MIDCSKCIHYEVCGNRFANDGCDGVCGYYEEPRQRGNWINFNSYYKTCPICNRTVGFDFADPEHGDQFKFCPNCGATMGD